MYRTLRIDSTTRIANEKGLLLSPREVPEAIQQLLVGAQSTSRVSTSNKPKASKR
ncbi:MAG: hypothetical protein ACYC5M_12675 [Anaerolineae bacterium]